MEAVHPEDILVMDEIGFLESEAMHFRETVLRAFERKGPVLAVIKERYDVPFLNEIRALPGTILFTVTPENREELYLKLREIVRSW